VLILVVVTASIWYLASENPTEEQHRAFVAAHYPDLDLVLGFAKIGGALRGERHELTYHNWIILSYMSVDTTDRQGKTKTLVLSVGYLGNIRE
jgi:hypothetical protein